MIGVPFNGTFMTTKLFKFINTTPQEFTKCYLLNRVFEMFEPSIISFPILLFFMHGTFLALISKDANWYHLLKTD